MGENIYDILAKFPKDMPTSSMESEPLYENVDPRNDLLEDVRKLEEKFYKYKATPQVSTDKTDDASDFKIAKAKRELQLAMAEYPEAGSPTEALVARMGDQAEETKRVVDTAKTTIAKQQQDIARAAQAVNDANARYDAQEKRFQDFTKQVAASELDVKQQAQAALAFAQQPQAEPQDIIAQTQAQVQAPAPVATTPEPEEPDQTPTAKPVQTRPATAPTPAANVVDIDAARKAKEAEVEKERLAKLATANIANPQIDWDDQKKVEKVAEAQEAANDVGIARKNWEILSNARLNPQPLIKLEFGDNPPVHLQPLDVEALYRYLIGKSTRYLGQKNQRLDNDFLKNLIKSNLNDYKTVNYLLKTSEVSKLRTAIKRAQTIAQKAKQTNIDYNAPEQVKTGQKPVQQPQQTQQPGLKGTEFYKYITTPRQRDLDFGNNNMNENIKNIAENLMERFMSFKEAAKPDFLDLDKDGDTEEPMKSAAKSAKEHEPAKPDSDAVAKRKRLQALKDKQEDERAEKGDDYKSASRFVKGRAYGGAAQKDDEDKDLDESGLQAYLGKKKYGKEGMKALQKAGREGASKEKMAVLRAKHDKMDEALPPGVTPPPKYVPSGNPLPNKQVGTKYTPQGTPVPVMAPKKPGELEEKAPPGAKAERMVKHIKKGYAKDGKLTNKEKAIAYATTWAAHKKGQVEEATEFGDTIKNSKAELKKHKMVKEGRNPESSEYTYETIGRILSDEQPGLDCNSEAFVKAVYDELIEMKLTPKAARWLVHYDEDFLSDCATSYSHFCDSKEKEAMECGAPINAFVSEEPLIDAVQELDEIARLAGLARENYNPMVPGDSASPLTYAGCSKCNADPCCCEDEEAMDEGMGCSEDELNEAATRKDFRMVADLLKSIPDMAKRTELAMYHADIFKQQNSRFKKEMFLAAAGVDTTPIKDVEDEVLVGEAEVEEGNEFSGALAKAKAAGEKEFEVDGKKYTVKEDININVSANGEEDVVNLIRKLSGMPVVAIQAQPAVAEEVVAEEGPKERDVEYTNTPREEVAGTDAAIPAGADLNRAKRQYKKEYPGDNPMAVAEAKEESLWKAYESMINDVKA
jgi:hypothetical protein